MGFKWVDLVPNGTRDQDEPGLAGVRIYIDLNENGVWNTDEPYAWTLEDDPDTAAYLVVLYEVLPTGTVLLVK